MHNKKRVIRTCPTCGNRHQSPKGSLTETCHACRAMKAAGIENMVRCAPEYRALWNGRGEHAQYCPLV